MQSREQIEDDKNEKWYFWWFRMKSVGIKLPTRSGMPYAMGNGQLSIIKYWAIQMLELKHSAHMGIKSFYVEYSYT